MTYFDEEPDGDLHGECTAEIHRLTRRTVDLEFERNDHMHRAHEATSQMSDCHKILDQIGAPRNQDNGLSYHLNGRLSRLIQNETGKLWSAELERVTAERDNLRYQLQTLLHAYYTGNSVSTIREAEMRQAAGLPK